jgi:hypothetical protein
VVNFFCINPVNLYPENKSSNIQNPTQQPHPKTNKMKTFATLTTLSALLSAAFALPSSNSQPASRSPVPTAWQVSNYTEGCSPAACVYNFNIAWGPTTSEPAFCTTCTGNDLATDFQPCDAYENQYVSTKEIPLVGGNLMVVVQHKWYKGEATYWVEGNATISQGPNGFPSDFEVVQSSEYAIA